MSTSKIKPSSEYRQDNISLRDAMTMELAEQNRVWTVPGLHVKLEGVFASIHDKETVIKTSVAKADVLLSAFVGNIFVGVQWKPNGSNELQFPKDLGLTWESLQEKYPELSASLLNLLQNSENKIGARKK